MRSVFLLAALTLAPSALAADDRGPLVYHAADTCEAGEGMAEEPNEVICFAAGSALWDGKYGTKADKTRAKALLERSCEGGYAMSCAFLGAVAEPSDKARIGLLERSCELDATVGGCAMLAALFAQGVGVVANGERAASYAMTGCEGGDPDACALATVFFGEGAVVTQDLAKSVELAKRSCDLYFENQDHDGVLMCKAASVTMSGAQKKAYKRKSKALKKVK